MPFLTELYVNPSMRGWGDVQLPQRTQAVSSLELPSYIKATVVAIYYIYHIHLDNPNAKAFFYNLKVRRGTNNLAMWDKRLFRLLVT